MGCSITEDGTVQTAFTLNWLDANGNIAATDTIKFQSDVDEVSGGGSSTPEPTTLAISGLGMGLLSIFLHRRRRASCN
ncbi:MAG: PEP-CTERM sorting domain-containing protein [Acidobacteria bacterium]|nr:PEP-CTERM sorting domain-containing protein [Acidobacteriota bacterium]